MSATPADLPPGVADCLRAEGVALSGDAATPVHGGDINRAVRVETRSGVLLVKLNAAERFDLFAAEADGLAALAQCGSIAVPAVVALGSAAESAYLALEWVEFAAPSEVAERRFGQALAAQHRYSSSGFGWHRDNYIGSTPQSNSIHASWRRFFAEERLRPQIDLACRHGLASGFRARVERLIEHLDAFFGADEPPPALLHGDLWGGNRASDRHGAPYLFDPAVHFGDREADLAMTRLFGGFGDAFYEAYNNAWPLAEGWRQRVGLYNLYHLLNHFNLFGRGYLSAIQRTLDELEPVVGGSR